jgi:hypothetical protein
MKVKKEACITNEGYTKDKKCFSSVVYCSKCSTEFRVKCLLMKIKKYENHIQILNGGGDTFGEKREKMVLFV